MTKMIGMIRKPPDILGAMLLFVSLPIAACAGMIRDIELETGLQKLMALLVEAANTHQIRSPSELSLIPSYNAFVAGEQIIYVHSG